MRAGTWGRATAAALTVAGVVGLGLVAAPAGAGAAPELPPVSPQELLSSVLAAKPQPFAGTVTIDNGLGLPSLPGAPDLANGTSTARVWSGGDDKGRVQLPSSGGERTLVSDGTTFWAWDSDTRTVTTGKADEAHRGGPAQASTDPAAAASEVLAAVSKTSTVAVDGTAEVAGRPAYELVLTPAPSERTLLREVRAAIDAQTRMPLRLTVSATGSTDPALRIGFSDIDFAAQDPALFTFTPPAGATVEQAPGDRPEHAAPAADTARVVGDGWDAVVVATLPADGPKPGAESGAPDLSTLGTPVSGAWGSGRLITTAVASVLITDDGRVAAGAVPEQVLTEALGK